MKTLLLVFLPAVAVALRPQLHFDVESFLGVWYLQYTTPGVLMDAMIPKEATDISVDMRKGQRSPMTVALKFFLPSLNQWKERNGEVDVPDMTVPAVSTMTFPGRAPVEVISLLSDYDQLLLSTFNKTGISVYSRDRFPTQDQRLYFLNVAHLAGIDTSEFVKIQHHSPYFAQFTNNFQQNIRSQQQPQRFGMFNPWFNVFGSRWPFQQQ